MDPNLWRLGDFVRENGMDFLVFTNGTMVTPEAARRLKETCTTVITKMFALDAGAHDLLVGVKGEYVKTRRALVELLGAGLRAPNLGIDLVITRQNRDDLENLLRVCRMLGVVPYFERLARTGRGKGLNGNIVLPDGEVDEVFRRLRKVDEAEFGLTWGVVPGMAALANAETDKRMVAVHVDVFGNVQPGLETGHIIGNFRDNGEGIEGVLNDCRAWAAYYRAVAADVGLEAGGEAAEAGAQPVDDAGPVRLPVMQAAYG
jgi:MoaA/NifB/PqqE/SkfB family radical SAM enzyme